MSPSRSLAQGERLTRELFPARREPRPVRVSILILLCAIGGDKAAFAKAGDDDELGSPSVVVVECADRGNAALFGSVS